MYRTPATVTAPARPPAKRRATARDGQGGRVNTLPLAAPGIASTALLSVILCWNEAFRSRILSAASTLAIAPILILGWFSQQQLARGLTFGAVK